MDNNHASIIVPNTDYRGVIVSDYHIMTECAPRGFVFPEVTA